MVAVRAQGIMGENPTALFARGVLGGLVSGAAFIGVTMWFADSIGDPAEGPLMMISTLIKGDEAMAAGTASSGLGALVHAVLSIAYGIIFALITPYFRTNGTVAIAGIAYGALLYAVNFLVLAPLAFPVLEMANQPFELVIHVLFGMILALAFFGSGVRSQESIITVGRDTSGTA